MRRSVVTAFVLGAGLGTRLRPLTDHRPKPLLPVRGRPLITYAMDHLIDAGVERFIINTHHLPECYTEAFPDGTWRGRPVLFRHEPVLLDTGGGLKNIEDLLGDDDDLWVYNGDIIADFPLKPLVEAHFRGDREVTLALRSGGETANVGLDAEGRIIDFRFFLGRRVARVCQFTGVYLVKRNFLARFSPGEKRDVIAVFIDMVRRCPGAVGSVIIDAGSWYDVGSRETYERLNAAWDFDDAIRLMGIPAVGASMATISRGGSDRSFRRLKNGKDSVIIMRYDPRTEENARYVSIGRYLAACGVPVPNIIHHDERDRIVVMEDLGDQDLWGFRSEPWYRRRPLYEQALIGLRLLHSLSPPPSLTLAEACDRATYAWERRYFRERFIAMFCGIDLNGDDVRRLEEEGELLCSSLVRGPRCLIHRDFQSQNIMIHRDRVFFIDFQGLRMGSPLYDLASLLYDPYVDLTDDERKEMAAYYVRHWEDAPTPSEFQDLLLRAAAQRLMQALGAYGFLGLVKGRRYFLEHIPRALRNLEDVIGCLKELGELRRLIGRCVAAMER